MRGSRGGRSARRVALYISGVYLLADVSRPSGHLRRPLCLLHIVHLMVLLGDCYTAFQVSFHDGLLTKLDSSDMIVFLATFPYFP